MSFVIVVIIILLLYNTINAILLLLLQVKQLVEGADAIGAVLVNRHQGFLPNKRQLRMGGLAALEMAQTLRQLVGFLVCWDSAHSLVLCHSDTLPLCI